MHLIDSIGWTLLHFVWQGALLGGATALALALLRRARPELRYNMACAALMACVLWPAAELSLRLQGANMLTAQMRYADAFLTNNASVGASDLLAWLQGQLVWIVGFWAVCAALLTLRMALGLLWIRRTERTQTSDAALQATVSRMAEQFGVTRAVRLRVVGQLASPLTVGWWRPVVLVPAALLSGMPSELLEALLAHEMAHIKRLDYLVNLGQNVAEILLFYHPAVWFISGRIRAEREQIADDLAARHTGEPRTLARALSELERLQFSHPQLALAANGGDLLARVKRLLRPDTEALNWKAAIPVLGLAAACLGVFAHASTGRDLALADQPPRANFSSCAKPAYPAEAIAAEHTGTVTLGFQIGADGRVLDSRISQSSGYRELDEAARSAITLCSFQPGLRHGQPVASWTRMQYVWTLE
ncbi:MAG: M56 family metallopeptidase [Pseudomonadota bacterium]